MYCHPFPSISLFFLSFLSFFSFHLFIFSHIPFFIFSFSLPLLSSISPSEFQREVSGHREYTRAKFLQCYTYICIFAYCVLYNIAGDLKRNIAPSVGRRGEEKCRFTEEDGGNIRNSLLRGDNKGRRGGGGKEVIFHVPAKYDGVVQQPLSFLQYFSPCFSYFFSFFLFFFLSLFPRKITGPECRTNENGLFVIISSRDARISLHFPSVLVIFRILSLYIYKFFLSLFLS